MHCVRGEFIGGFFFWSFLLFVSMSIGLLSKLVCTEDINTHASQGLPGSDSETSGGSLTAFRKKP